jgi:UDP-N-acetylglucosamine:LPS N-acetylglucosamine transferase
MPHLLVDLSPHGFGHIAQTAPVVNELARRVPNLRVTVRCAAPGALLAQRFDCAYDHLPLAFDFGMAMANAVDVQVEESALAYEAFHSGWEQRVAREAEALSLLAPDLLLANVPYLTLAAASRAGVPAVGMCSLNWADIYGHYCGHRPEAPEILGQMLEAYNSAAAFLRVTPSMPMPDLDRARSVGPIAHPSRNRRTELAAALGASPGEKLVLLAMGGLDFRLPVERWPRLSGVRWLVPAAWGVEREDVSAWETPGLPFSDILASSDAVLTKPGYGTFAEAACAGVPVLYVARRDWPEEPWLVQWLRHNDACLEVARDALEEGDLGGVLERLWRLPRPTPPIPTGAGEAADYLVSFFP